MLLRSFSCVATSLAERFFSSWRASVTSCRCVSVCLSSRNRCAVLKKAWPMPTSSITTSASNSWLRTLEELRRSSWSRRIELLLVHRVGSLSAMLSVFDRRGKTSSRRKR